MKFIDVFAGLGGFHTGCADAGFECVFASELDKELRALYKLNFGIDAHGDITKINEQEIPEHDLICAGFPCQPFSLAGKKKGAKCPESGKLIDHVQRIARYHKPKFIILENVPNILTIENGKFWKYLQKIFGEIGYRFKWQVMSPIDFNIPQNRKRVFIIGSLCEKALESFKWPTMNCSSKTFDEFLDVELPHKILEERKQKQIIKWQELLDIIGLKDFKSISLVAPEFGATYPLDFHNLTLFELKKYKGAYGANLSECKSWNEVLALMPAYTRKNKSVSDWLKKSALYSRNVYKANGHKIDQWKKGLDTEYNSWQILEWRGDSKNLNVFDHLIQFRASGMRVSNTKVAPSLIAMTPTQIPIISSQMRYISEFEAAKLQGLESLNLPSIRKNAFKALGNAVNAKIIKLIAHELKAVS
ncbi:MAG: DNA (cytosine-5-)-methyltransferase [Xanthomonadales bacterium]|nr:DNA (cytosine-5-)-methyltransferase [Xanthomonadales bacterium]